VADENNIIAALPLVEWRSLVAPCEAAPFSGGHDMSERRFPYKDGAGHDNTGRKPYSGKAVLNFGNGLGRAPDGSLWFPDTWQKWQDAVEDGSIGLFVHPVIGSFDARVLSWDSDGPIATKRDGIRVTVSWVESVKDIAQGTTFITTSVSVAAAAAEAAANSKGVYYPTGQPDNSLLDAINSIQGQIFSITTALAGKLNQVTGAVDKMIGQVEALNDATAWPAMDNLLLVFAWLRDKSDTVAAQLRSTATVKTTADTTLDAFARQVGNELTDVIALNLAFSGKPTVPKGATLTYYTDK